MSLPIYLSKSSGSLRRRVLLLSLLCTVTTLLYTRFSHSPQSAVKAAWTLMIYQDADNNLEAPSIANLREMLKIGSSEQVQVVVLSDRSKKSEPKEQYTDGEVGGLKNWDGAKLLHVQKEKLQEVADWGNTNMGSPATLQKFVETAAQKYPAERYGLILMDHGTGWSELCVDEGSGDKALTLRDLRNALEPFTKSQGKLELVGIDACLMASFETAQALAPVTRFLVASEELAPARGWNYDATLKALTEKPEMTGFDLGRTIVDAYTIFFNQATDPMTKFEGLAVTLSVLELDTLGPLQSALSALGDQCTEALRNKQRAGWINIARARSKSEEYGAVSVRGEGGEEMHDLIHLATLLEQSPEPGVAEAARQVGDAARKVVRYGMRSPLRPRSGGISVYFPREGVQSGDPESAQYLSQTFAKESRWVRFLALYAVAVEDFSEEPNIKPVEATAQTASPEKPVEIISHTPDKDIDTVHVVMLAHNGPDMLMVGRLPSFHLPDGEMRYLFRGLWFMLTDQKKVVTCPITNFEPLDEKNNRFLAYVPALIRRPGSPEWLEAEFTFYITIDKGPRGQLIHVFADTKQGPLQITLKKGDEIRPVYTRITPDGEVSNWSPERELASIQIEDPKDFSVAWGKVGRGRYQVGFEVVNLAGLLNLELTDVVLE